MKRIRETQNASKAQFDLLFRGEMVLSALADAVNAVNKTVHFAATVDLTEVNATSGFLLVDTITSKAAKVVGKAGQVLTLDEWTDTLATQRVKILRPIPRPQDIVGIEFDDGRILIYDKHDDGIVRELDVDRVEVAWLKATGAPVAARDYSDPFYVHPGVGSVCLEIVMAGF